MIAGIEIGGTKTVVAIGTVSGTVIEEIRFPTTTPEATLKLAVDWFIERGNPTHLGIATFGPVGLVLENENYGKILATPKLGWTGFSIINFLSHYLPHTKFVLETDTHAAALAESKIGVATGLEHVVYITVGTGIGVGILSSGKMIHGTSHPEFGHLKVPRKPGDTFTGVCPFHTDCLEGLASGPAIHARWGKPAHELTTEHPAWDTEVWYLAHGILSLVAILSPSVIIVGGGVSQSPHLHQKLNSKLIELAGGYFPQVLIPDYIVPPTLGQQAGIQGALLLAAYCKISTPKI